jgi:hypothetical protein
MKMESQKKELSLVVENDIKEGPIVAVQYPETPSYVATVETGTELAEKYKHLMRIEVDDKDAYTELCAAIKFVSQKRIDNENEEDVIKKPLNAFRKIVIDTGKSIRKNIKALAEDKLNAEKKRIDDIKQERILEQQRLWTKNLGEVRQLGQYTPQDTTEKLEETLATVDNFDTSKIDLGDYEDEALTEIALIKVRLETAIEQRKEADRLKKIQEEQEAQRLKDLADLEAKRIADQKAIDDANAVAEKLEKEKEALLEKLAVMEAGSAEPDSVEAEKSEQNIGSQEISMQRLTRSPESPLYRPAPHIAATSPKHVPNPFDSTPPTTTRKVAIDPQHCEDHEKIDEFIEGMNTLIAIAPQDFDSNKYSLAVNRVIENMIQAVSFLRKQKK